MRLSFSDAERLSENYWGNRPRNGYPDTPRTAPEALDEELRRMSVPVVNSGSIPANERPGTTDPAVVDHVQLPVEDAVLDQRATHDDGVHADA